MHHQLPLLLFLLILWGCQSNEATDPTDLGSEPAPANHPDLAPASAPGEDAGQANYGYTFEPGLRFGRMDQFTRPADFAFLFGENLNETEIHIGEGFTVPGYRAFEGEAHDFEILLPNQAEGMTTIAIKVLRADGPWRMEGTDIGVGATLAELEAANGKPFTFLGFGWDYGGIITDWAGGKLEGLGGSLALDPDVAEHGGIDESIYGDQEIMSNNERLKGSGIVLGEINFAFEDPSITEPGQSAPVDFTVVPSVRLGLLNHSTTAEDLRHLYIDQDLRKAEFEEPGGLVLKGYRLYPGTKNEVSIALPEDNPGDLEDVRIRIERPGGEWHLAGTSIGVGSTLAEVEAANGQPYSIMSYNYENAGEVMDWNNGLLRGVSLFFDDLSIDQQQKLTYDEEEEFLSTSSGARAANMHVGRIELWLSKPGE